ncbi:hypothetical protein T01_1635 [Trichinella spiralis]|uniref:Uncharacterized protein n=1 Tax=Trichinella spiralis TaxID=6334 RepID=A0A0V1AKU8_TRISP|nr:hypothetical protein T01_1635 [Trichinella spiralis]
MVDHVVQLFKKCISPNDGRLTIFLTLLKMVFIAKFNYPGD